MQDIQAKLRFLPLSAQKVRLVIDMVRGKDVVVAFGVGGKKGVAALVSRPHLPPEVVQAGAL